MHDRISLEVYAEEDFVEFENYSVTKSEVFRFVSAKKNNLRLKHTKRVQES